MPPDPVARFADRLRPHRKAVLAVAVGSIGLYALLFLAGILGLFDVWVPILLLQPVMVAAWATWLVFLWFDPSHGKLRMLPVPLRWIAALGLALFVCMALYTTSRALYVTSWYWLHSTSHAAP
jgi:hypothetical protein